MKLFASLIAADLLNLERTIKTLNAYIDGYHLDIMDNHFVPNLTWGPLFINAIARSTKRQLWIHLMVDDPHHWPAQLELPENTMVSFHLEAKTQPLEMIQMITEKNWIPSIALNPETGLEKLNPYLDIVEQVLLMSVRPGFSGQSFIPETLVKLKTLAEQRIQNNYTFTIAMDGGINKNNIHSIAEAGANQCAIASGIFAQPDPIAALTELIHLSKITH